MVFLVDLLHKNLIVGVFVNLVFFLFFARLIIRVFLLDIVIHGDQSVGGWWRPIWDDYDYEHFTGTELVHENMFYFPVPFAFNMETLAFWFVGACFMYSFIFLKAYMEGDYYWDDLPVGMMPHIDYFSSPFELRDETSDRVEPEEMF